VPPNELFKRSDYIIYQIDCRFEDIQWSIFKRFRELTQLHVRVCKLCKPFADSNGFSYQELLDASKLIPTTIARHEMRPEQLEERREGITKYLQKLVESATTWGLIAVKEFFEVGAGSFNRQLGRKGKEGYLFKSSGG
jgi:hypothetical protein